MQTRLRKYCVAASQSYTCLETKLHSVEYSACCILYGTTTLELFVGAFGMVVGARLCICSKCGQVFQMTAPLACYCVPLLYSSSSVGLVCSRVALCSGQLSQASATCLDWVER